VKEMTMEGLANTESAYSFYHEGTYLRVGKKVVLDVQLPNGLMLEKILIQNMLIHCVFIDIIYGYGFSCLLVTYACNQYSFSNGPSRALISASDSRVLGFLFKILY